MERGLEMGMAAPRAGTGGMGPVGVDIGPDPGVASDTSRDDTDY